MDLSVTRSGHGGSGSRGGGDVHHLPPEYRLLVHRHLVDIGDMSGVGEADMGTVVNAIVGKGRTGTGAGRVIYEDRDVVGGGSGIQQREGRVGLSRNMNWEIEVK